jgi:hypothetical protein
MIDGDRANDDAELARVRAFTHNRQAGDLMSSLDAIRRSSSDSGSNSSDRAALIEQLLLAGLDQYFSGHYEQAIHVWTRVFFLDRGHARARAYIERARGALAEKQREAEAQGLDESSSTAVGAVRVVSVTSRVMVESATARGVAPRRFSRRDLLLGSSELPMEEGAAATATATAPAMLATLDAEIGDSRPDRSDRADRGDRADRTDRAETASGSGTRLRTHVVLVTLAVVLLCSAGYLVLDRDRLATWWRMPADPATGGLTSTPILTTEPLPVPRASEQALAHARTLYERGRLHEALRALTPIRVDDPLRRDADILLAEIQRALLDSAGASVASSAARPSLTPTPTTTPISPR